MTRNRIIFILLLLFMMPGVATGQTRWKQVSSSTFDWDVHKNVTLTLEVPHGWSDPGDFIRLRILVPGRKEFILSNKQGWVKYGSEDASTSPEIRRLANVIGSQHVLAVRVAEKRTVLFLFGYSYASSPGSLDVVALSRDGQPRVVFHKDEFGLKDVRDLDADGITEIIGYPCLSEEFGNGLLTYDPFNVYKLGSQIATPARLSLPLSKSYNLKHYYGWSGAQCREDIAVVLHPPKGGRPVIMSTKKAQKLTESNPQH